MALKNHSKNILKIEIVIYKHTKSLKKKVKRLRAYARALVDVANTLNIVSTKFAWTFINIEFLQCIFKSRKRLSMFHIIRDQFPNLRS